MELWGDDGDHQVDTEAHKGHPETGAGDISHDGVKLVPNVVTLRPLRLTHNGCAHIANVELLGQEGFVVVGHKEGVVLDLEVARAELHLGAGLQISHRAGHVRLGLIYNWDSCGSQESFCRRFCCCLSCCF